jgi:hypothetical protein
MLIDPLTEEADARIAFPNSAFKPSRIFSGYCHLYRTSTDSSRPMTRCMQPGHWSATIGFRTTLTLRE